MGRHQTRPLAESRRPHASCWGRNWGWLSHCCRQHKGTWLAAAGPSMTVTIDGTEVLSTEHQIINCHVQCLTRDRRNTTSWRALNVEGVPAHNQHLRLTSSLWPRDRSIAPVDQTLVTGTYRQLVEYRPCTWLQLPSLHHSNAMHRQTILFQSQTCKFHSVIISNCNTTPLTQRALNWMQSAATVVTIYGLPAANFRPWLSFRQRRLRSSGPKPVN